MSGTRRPDPNRALHDEWFYVTERLTSAQQTITIAVAELKASLDTHDRMLRGNGSAGFRAQLEMLALKLETIRQEMGDALVTQHTLVEASQGRGAQVDSLLRMQKWLIGIGTTLLLAVMLGVGAFVWMQVTKPPLQPARQEQLR